MLSVTLLALLMPPALARTVVGEMTTATSEFFGTAPSVISGLLGLISQSEKGMPLRARPLPPWIDPQKPPTKEEREAKVSKLEINVSRDVRLEPGQAITFSAVPLDFDGNAVHGLVAEWGTSDNRVIFTRRDGRARAGEPGTAFVIASAGHKKETVRVTVVGAEAAGSNKVMGGGGKGRRTENRTSQPRISKAVWEGDESLSAGRSMLPSSGAKFLRTALLQQQPNDPLPNEETRSLYKPANAVGTPPGKTRPGARTASAAIEGVETAGRANYTFGLPIASLPGRGLDVSLGLVYNSRVWHESTTLTSAKRLTFDVDRGWPAPGFNLGYGHVEKQGSYGYTLVDSDGTRHQMAQITWVSTHGYDSFETTDGTFIRYYGNQWPNWLYYPDGTRVELTGGSETYNYPVRIIDSNGNYISINYVNGIGPRISSVQDTMGRYVRFHYDAANNLVAVTVPGYAGGDDRQAIRFYYTDAAINTSGSFNGVTVNAPTSARLISHIFYPGTNTGYRFDYSLSYGMIRQANQLRGMSVSYTGLDQTGAVTGEGQTAATTVYDYPTGPSGLTGAPLYSQRCDDWAGRTVGMNGNISQWPCQTFTDDLATGESTVTVPDGTLTVTRSIVSSDETLDGLVTETEVKSV